MNQRLSTQIEVKRENTKALLGPFFLYFLTLLVVLITIINSWGVVDFLGEKPNLSPTKLTEETESNLDRSIAMQSRLLVGADFYLKKESYSKDLIQPMISSSISQMLTEIKQSLAARKKLSNTSLRTATILGLYYGQNIEAEKTELINRQQTKVSVLDKLIVNRVNSFQNDTKNELLNSEIEFLQDELGWLGDVFLLATETDPKLLSLYKEQVETATESQFLKFSKIAFVMSIFALSSIALFSFGLLRHISKSDGLAKFRFTPTTSSSSYLLEIFCIYMVLMLAGGLLIRFLIQQEIINPSMKIQVLGIAPSLLAIFFPVVLGRVSFQKVREDIGLKLDGWGLFLRDILTTPFIYVAAWSPFFVLLVGYSIVVQYFHLDMNESGHPIVPILAGSDNNNQIIVIAILAVVMAPIIEEIMFRGALYGWLRSNFSYTASLIISGLIFAAVHPQGPLGVFPLALIGMFLAALREWRGTLLAPMIAHACVNAGTLTLVLSALR